MNEERDVRRLLSEDVDGLMPWLDPQVPIDAARVAHVSAKTNLSTSDVHRLYEGIAHDFGLTLQWEGDEERREA